MPDPLIGAPSFQPLWRPDSLWGSIAQTSVSRVFLLASTVLTLSMTSRRLGPEGRGVVAAALAWVSVFGTALCLSYGQVIIHTASRARPAEWLSRMVGSLLVLVGVLGVAGWIAVAAADGLLLGNGIAGGTPAGWPVALAAVYLPMLYLVLRRPSSRKARKIEKERRRPHRLADHELKIDVTSSTASGVIVKVTHLPTQLSTTESGRTRELAERKAQDKLAAIVAAASRPRTKADRTEIS